jgi:two-component system, chemotaxis family, CheB/CheR fusion protein
MAKNPTAVARKRSVPPRLGLASSPPTIDSTAKRFPIVALGASAGGLEALEQFFSQVPAQSGMAFVVVSHLDPTRAGVMPELLQRSTPMRVVQAKEGMKVVPDHVYVIPPNKDLSIAENRLHLEAPALPRGMRLPIDYFLRSLALERHERGIAVILSGMGSDGALGAQAVKDFGGWVLAQDPASAKFDSMPRSVIDAGVVDIIAPPADLSVRIIDCLNTVLPEIAASAGERDTSELASSFDQVLDLVRERSGSDFSLYKKTTLHRRIERRMSIHHISRITDYVRHLRANPVELDLLFKELLIGVTAFFRDPAVWEDLQDLFISAWFADAIQPSLRRAWVAGCSTGEEAYSLAIAFREAQERVEPTSRTRLQIFATDLDSDAIDRARRGFYPATITADISPARLARFFVAEQGGYRIVQEIRETVVFAPHNVTMQPPFTQLDILCCRNVLIYFNLKLQKKLLPLFHYSLKPGGLLFLGGTEGVGVHTDLFEAVNRRSHVYRALDRSRLEIEFPSEHKRRQAIAPKQSPPAGTDLQTLAEQLLLREFSLPAVLVSAQGDILYLSAHTGSYLEPAAGKANWNIYAMAKGQLCEELLVALPKALREKQTIYLSGVVIGANRVDVTLRAIDEASGLRGMVMIVFKDQPAASRPARRTGRKSELEIQLQQAHDKLRSFAEEMQTSKEELRSINEELQSSNEELQSSNEELTTSKEEMQSLNEELQTVNAELHAKLDDLSVVNSDLRNLLNSTDIAIVFLDNALNVRRFTSHATKIFRLLASDSGRPLADLANVLDYPALQDDAKEVLRTLIISEKEITTRDAHWYVVKILPYRTVDNVIDGVVLTFTDISAAKRLEAELRQTRPA